MNSEVSTLQEYIIKCAKWIDIGIYGRFNLLKSGRESHKIVSQRDWKR